MELRDLFVATVALVIGCMMVHTAILNQGWFFQMKIARVIAESKGRAQARTFVGSVGALMIVMGLYLLLAPFAFTFLQRTDDPELPNSQSVGTINLADID